MKRQAFLSALLLVFLSRSCTILEDRNACPCRLVLDLSEVVEFTHPKDALQLSLSGPDGFSWSDHFAWEDLEVPYQRAYRIPRGERRLLLATAALTIAEGEDCPPLWLHTEALRLEGESFLDTIHLHKRFCQVDMQVRKAGRADYPFVMHVSGRIAGYAEDGSPLPGVFSRTLYPDAEGRASLRLPCQLDDSLLMSLVLEGHELVHFALGSYILASGYDWQAEDLADLSLELDYSATEIRCTIDQWSTVIRRDVLL